MAAARVLLVPWGAAQAFVLLLAAVAALDPSEGLRGLVGKPIDLSIRLKDPQDLIVQKGQSAQLRCDAQISPQLQHLAQFEWYHDDQLLDTTTTNRVQLQPNGSLYFPKVSAGRKSNVTGQYRCMVRVGSNRAVLSAPATLKLAVLDKDVSVEVFSSNVTELDTAVLRCKVHSVPQADVQWFVGMQLLPQSTKYVPLPSGTLLILQPNTSDTGLYSCRATNNFLKKTRHSSSVQLNVLKPSTDNKAPVLLPINQPNNITVPPNNNLDLYCACTSNPVPKYAWYYNNDTLVGSTEVLHLTKVQAEHTGQYKCICSNNLGKAVRLYNVQIVQKPYFVTSPLSKAYPSAITVRLSCNISGQPQPDIQWLKNGQPLKLESRIDVLPGELRFKQSFTYDSGIYQCVGQNQAGIVWSAAEILINVTDKPGAPENVQCRPYNETSLCLTWQVPANIEAKAFTIDFPKRVLDTMLTNETHKLLTGLNQSTVYEMYVRLYTKAASDNSVTVQCQTATAPQRNLTLEKVSDSVVKLTWNELLSDRPCGGTRGHYIVQWRTKDSVNTTKTDGLTITLNDLQPGLMYEYKVNSNHSKHRNTWQTFPNNNTTTKMSDVHNIQIDTIQSNSITISWAKVDRAHYYTICMVPSTDSLDCEDGKFVESTTNRITVPKLKPGTMYEFRVRPHSNDGSMGQFSGPLLAQTRTDVPSAVLNLQYRPVNSSTACIAWQAPTRHNNNLELYLVSYTPDSDWPLDQWINISIPLNQSSKNTCWPQTTTLISFYLNNLQPDLHYTVLVRASSPMGIGKPTLPIIVSTQHALLSQQNEPEKNHHTLGLLLGLVLAAISCITCILLAVLRWSCVKRRQSNNNYPAVARYASHGSFVQMRLEQPIAEDSQEVQQLVQGPNGHLNGHSAANQKPNGLVCHITENPHYDPNSNSLGTSKFYELHKLFENSKKTKSNADCSPHFGSNMRSTSHSDLDLDLGQSDYSLDATQMTCLDLNDSILSSSSNGQPLRRVSPILGPNG